MRFWYYDYRAAIVGLLQAEFVVERILIKVGVDNLIDALLRFEWHMRCILWRIDGFGETGENALLERLNDARLRRDCIVAHSDVPA